MAFDLDHRPDDPNVKKYGPADLELLAEWYGERITDTISVTSGRNAVSRHDYFKLPAGIQAEDLISHFPAIDIIKNGYCVAPGSMHLTGNLYRFAEECSPMDMDLAELPGWMLSHFYEVQEALSLRASAGRGPVSSVDLFRDKSDPPDGSIAAGQFRSDAAVMDAMRKDKVAGRILRGDAGRDRSKADHVMFCKLAFYTAHHWKQYRRLAVTLPLAKQSPWRGYFEATIDKAFVAQRSNCIKKSKSATVSSSPGRPFSDDTRAVIQAITHTRSLRPSEIATDLDIAPAKVYNILSRHSKGFYVSQDFHLSQ